MNRPVSPHSPPALTESPPGTAATATASSTPSASPWPQGAPLSPPPAEGEAAEDTAAASLTTACTPRPVRCRQCRGLFLWAAGSGECRRCAQSGAPEIILAGGGVPA